MSSRRLLSRQTHSGTFPRRYVRVPTVQEKLTEAEGYYDILCAQVQSTVARLDSSREDASAIKETGNAMLGSLSECIRIMKIEQGDAAVVPEEGVANHHPPPLPQAATVQFDPALRPHPSSRPIANHSPWRARRRFEPCAPTPSPWRNRRRLVEPGTPTPRSGRRQAELEDSDHYHDASSIHTVSSDEFYDAEMRHEEEWDGEGEEIAEDDDYVEEEDLGAMSSHRSMILHILSQLRVGLDLTKISLPSFILEKRSLLEMYGEFFSVPELFVAPADLEDPKDRMIAMLRWYLATFYAGRKGTVAKKPYNPILGETFRCFWNLPESSRVTPTEYSRRLVRSGPMPQANYNSVSFMAEQVSHHPPVSGFYAECPAKRVYANGSFWSRTRLLGFSVGVQNIGSGRIHLLDYGEEYTFNSPTIYVRSPMTVPWLEIGGRCSLHCRRSGYHADIEFHCKPFYGGRKHHVTAEIFHVREKRALLKVDGEWNHMIYAHYPNGRREEFLNAQLLQSSRKVLRKPSAMDPMESRRVWHDVTEALRNDDLDAAAAAKHIVEERQRVDVRDRQHHGIEWQQKDFHQEEDVWVYNETLDCRLRREGQNY